MKTIYRTIFTLAILSLIPLTVNAGIYSTALENTNPGASDSGIAASDSRFIAWATSVVEYVPAPGVSPAFQNSDNALGPHNGSLVVLGDLNQEQINAGALPGYIILAFETAIANGLGADLAVFENGFMSGGKLFAELAYVEVSTNGEIFSRFPSVSLTPGLVGAYGTIDPTDVYNLAGKHASGWGTPFDLEDLADDANVLAGDVDLGEIHFVKIVDIPGSGDFQDSLGNPIYDAWVTWGTGGFDLDAVGVINQWTPSIDPPVNPNATATPEPGTLAILGIVALGGLMRIRRNRK